MYNYDRTASSALETTVEGIRRKSEAAWEQAADDHRDDSKAKKFTKAWDAWGESWDDAEVALSQGLYRDAVEALTNCAYRERDYGSDEHAQAAIKAIQTKGPTYSSGGLAQERDKVYGGETEEDYDEGRVYDLKPSGQCMVAWSSGDRTSSHTQELSRLKK